MKKTQFALGLKGDNTSFYGQK